MKAIEIFTHMRANALFLRVGPLAIFVSGVVLTMVWASLLGYEFFAVIVSAI